MKYLVKTSLAFIYLTLILCHGQARQAAPAVEASVYAQRRAALLQKAGNGLLVIQGAEERHDYLPFRQNNDFYYLTGIDKTANALLIIDGRSKRTILFLPPYNASYERWNGKRLAPGPEAVSQTGITETRPISEFEQVISELTNGEPRPVYLTLAPEELLASERNQAQQVNRRRLSTPWDKRISREQAFANYFEGRKLEIRNLSPLVDELRWIKGPEEIELMRQASQIASEGHLAVFKAVRPGMYEYQIAALAEYVFKRAGSQGPAYFAITGSGPNSCVLHYHHNHRQVKDGDLVVFDFAPDFGYYASDVTRTFPVNGKFTAEQRKVYQTVLAAQKAAIAAVKPGVTFADLTKIARDIVEKAGYGRYWVHGLGHYIGMGVHDVGEYNKPFEPGVLITVEPGIYIPEKELGVRIEDVVLVTKDGHEVLSTVPKELDELERLMNDAKQRK